MMKLTAFLLSLRQGAWGESHARKFLIRNGMKVIGKNVRPSRRDGRYEIDIICKTEKGTSVVFVEVKTHIRKSPYSTRLWKIDKRKKNALRHACYAWLKRAGWQGNYRFDVVQVYGDCRSGLPPEIDHIENVKLF